MTTHELANVLEGLLRLLRSAPDRELNPKRKQVDKKYISEVAKRPTGVSDLALAKLSNSSKGELLAFLMQHRIPVPVRSKDSAAEILRRLKKYLEDNRSVKKMVRNRVAHGETSPEVSRALSYLLQDRYE